jgi:hypothetical protein
LAQKLPQTHDEKKSKRLEKIQKQLNGNMSVRRSRRTAAAAAETRIARAVEADSEDSNGSNYAGNSNNSSDPEDTASSGNASDADFEISSSGPRQYGGKKKSNHPSPQKRPTPSLVPIAPAATAPVPVQQLSAATTPAAEATTSTTSTTSSSTNANSAYKELSDDSLKSMIRSFRLTDLQALMIFVGKNKAGRKTELMVSRGGFAYIFQSLAVFKCFLSSGKIY